jgi:hypothetical protein
MHASRWDTSLLGDGYLLCIEMGWKAKDTWRNSRRKIEEKNLTQRAQRKSAEITEKKRQEHGQESSRKIRGMGRR